MEPAPELVTFFNKFIDLWAALDIEQALDGVSRQPGVLLVGTDPEEWWGDYGSASAVMKVQWQEFKSMGGFRFDVERISAAKEGTVGWIAARGKIAIGSRTPLPMTCTVVAHEEGTHWRMVQFHTAIDSPNQQTVGRLMTTSVDDLLLQVQGESPPAAGMSIDGSVTIVFTDVEGSTTLLETLGEQRWLNLLDWHNSVLTQQVRTFGGTVVKGEGDGFMLAFPASGAATACAIAIQRAFSAGLDGVRVPVRIGIHAGNAKAEAGDFFGRTVVLAARIANAAKGGEILMSEAVQVGLGGAFALEGARSLTLKGLEGDQLAFSVLWD
jgi:adenylate cyclase